MRLREVILAGLTRLKREAEHYDQYPRWHLQAQALLLRKLPGVMPTTFLKARVMWL